MSKSWETISVESLKDVTILFDGDIYEFAQFLLNVNDAKDRGSSRISRHTVHGWASAYCNLADMAREDILRVFKRHGLPLDASVEHANRIANRGASSNGGPAAPNDKSNT